MRRRFEQAFGQFIDAGAKSDHEIASLLRQMEIDIAVDLMGFTEGGRPGIFTHRPAPIQVNYLGYPGTVGGEWLDYLIADRVVVPDEQRRFYAERIVYLPDSYLPRDTSCVPSPGQIASADEGLPETGFVFACFNNTYKLNPVMFDIWMRLLRAVDGSVLWLPKSNLASMQNLAREAHARGVAPDRLVFAPFRKAPEQHLARLRLADLFLDTLPYNAHTTASDALWAGVPVLTCLGATFAGRVAGSLLRSLQLPELITESLADYEAAALRLARDAGALGAIREKLERHRNDASTFDEARFARTLGGGLFDDVGAVRARRAPRELRSRSMNDPRLQAALGLHQSGNLPEAARIYGEVLRSEPENFDALYLLGHVHSQNRDFVQAERLMRAALNVNPRALDALHHRGRVLLELKSEIEALACFEAMLAINPDIPEALFERANIAAANRRFAEALADYDRVVALVPQFAEVWNNRANVLASLGRHEDAVGSYGRALSLKPGDPRTLNHRAIALLELKRYEDAAHDFADVLKTDREFPYAKGNLLYSRLHCCDWQGVDEGRADVIEDLHAGKRVLTPIQAVAIVSSSNDQLQCSRIWTADQFPPAAEALWQGERYRHERIRLAYLSADLHAHATAFLMAGVFEAHDKGRFETIALSFGPDDGSHMRQRLKDAFGRFIDVRDKSDLEIGRIMREMEVDVAVDLGGHAQGARPGILALRPSPVQVHYLGFPGSLGASYVDYILADGIVIPEEQAFAYSEKVVTLPESYQCNDRARLVAPGTPSRTEAGLPEIGFVFCSFNNSFKIRPQILDLWMRLLRRVEGSVLWLLGDNAAAVQNLRREAERRGVAAGRLVFAPRDSLHRHLARHRLAHLVLDTLPCGAHTTASDALWAGSRS